jgi:hypothetical protein
MLPSNPHSIIRLVDGRVAACQVIDYSLSGVAVSAEKSPKVGAIVKIGEILGQVLRHTAEGFTVEFLLVQNARTIENLFLRERRSQAIERARQLWRSRPHFRPA